jgi:hypothetical protein
MAKKTRPAKATKIRKSTSTLKGRIVEQIVADLHVEPGVHVRKNVRLPVAGSKRTREIDVLLEGYLASYPIRYAFECKNYKVKIGVKQVDSFIGELNDVGIPTNCAAIISAVGFTEGAIERAEKAGVKTMVLSGLESGRLKSMIDEAVQSNVYLLLNIERVVVKCNLDRAENDFELLTYRDHTGQVVGLVPDIVWNEWLQNRIPPQVGVYTFKLTPPPAWKVVVDGKDIQPHQVEVTLRVTGLVVTISGESTTHGLSEAKTNDPVRFKSTATFDPSQRKGPIIEYYIQSALDAHLENLKKPVSLVQRIPLPRIRFQSMLWPPSERVASLLLDNHRKWIAAGKPLPRPFPSFDQLEGSGLATMGEPIWDKHPLVASERWLEVLASIEGLSKPKQDES